MPSGSSDFNRSSSLEYPELTVLGPVEGGDQDDLNENLMARLLSDNSDLVGVYNVGAGTPGVAKAITDAERERDIVFVAHDLTHFTRRCLLRGVMDAVISQDPGTKRDPRSASCMSLVRNEPILSEQEKIRIDIVMRDNLP